MALVTLDKVKDFVGETTTNNDDFLNEQIALFSSAVEGYCGRKFESTSYTQTFEAQAYESYEMYKLISFHFPIISVTEIKEVEKLPDMTTNETTLAVNEYTPETQEGIFHRTNTCNQRIQWFGVYGNLSQVVMTYTAGYATVPLEIQDTVCNLVAERYTAKINNFQNLGKGIQRISIPGVMSIDYDYTLAANERKTRYGMLLGDYVNILDFWRSERVVSGSIKENYVS